MAVISRDLGPVTAYAAAVNRGYTGTREEFETLMASYATVAEQAGESAESAEESAASAAQSAASASQSAQNAESSRYNALLYSNQANGYKNTANIAAQAAKDARDAAQSAHTAAEAAQAGAEAAVDGFDDIVTAAISDVNAAGTNQKELAKRQAEKSEAWAVGQISGEDVGVSDPAYHNNAKYYAESAATTATTKASEAAQSADTAASSAAAAGASATAAQQAQQAAEAAAEQAEGAIEVDDTLSVAGRAADAKKTGDEITRLKEVLSESLPHAKIIEFQNKTFNMSSGEITTDNPTRLISELLVIQEGDTFSMDSDYQYMVFRFNRQGKYLANPIAWTSGDTQFTATSLYGNYLHRIYVRKNDSVSAITADEIGITFDIASIHDTYFNVEDKIDNKYSGLLALKKEWKTVEQKTGTVTTGKFLKIDGTEISSDAWNYITLNVNSGEQYAVSAYAGLDARLWLILSANDNVLLYSTDNSPISLKTEIITIPSGAAKLIVNQNNAEINEILVEKIDILNVVEKKSVPDNLLSGKVLCCVGDSITYGADMDSEGFTNVSNITMYQCDNSGVFSEVTSRFRKTWGYQIAERNNMVFYNGGVSGSTMQGENGINGFSLANGRYTKLPDTIDYLVIWFGWNDTAYGTLGTITDDTNDTFYGGYNVVIPYLQNKYPYAKILLVVPYGTNESHRNAVRQLGNKWGLAVWDNYQGGTPLYYGKEPSVGVKSSVVTANQAKFQANGAHPNYRGHKQLADMIEEFIRGI